MNPVASPVASHELEPQLSDEARTWQLRAREFGEEVVRPIGAVLDRMDHRAAVAPGSPIFDFLAQAHREGLTRLTDPRDLGGCGLSRMTEYIVLEELAVADAGLTALLIAAPLPFRWAGTLGSPGLAAELSVPYTGGVHPDWVGCCAAAGRPGLVRAVRDGEGWSLDGVTSPWVTGAATATHAMIACSVAGTGRPAVALVPLDRPGISRALPPDPLGLRSQARARIVLQDVRVTVDELLIEPPGGPSLVGAARALAHVSTAVLAVGIARAAYEGAYRWRSEHAGGGLDDHASRRLFGMFSQLEAARAVTRAVHRYTCGRADAGDGSSIQHAAAANAFATEAACEVVDGAMDLCGREAADRQGVTYPDGSSFHLEKLLRDAQSYRVLRPRSIRPGSLSGDRQRHQGGHRPWGS